MASDQDTSRIDERLGDSAVPQVAAICIRDHWDELTPEQRDWCVNCVCHRAAEGGDNHDRMGNMMLSRVTLIPDYGFGCSHAGADSRAESVVRSVVGIAGRKMSQAVVVPNMMA